MSTISSQPENFNYFSPIGFKFDVDKLPNVNFFCQSATLPGLTLGEATAPNPFRDIPVPGDKILFEELTIRFIVDEELQNWLEMKDWIFGLGYPESQDQYEQLANTNRGVKPFGDRYSDGSLMILTSHKNAQIKVTFQNLWPVTLSGIQLDSSVAEVDYVTADATFAYTIYKVERLIGER
jgi:hypothetical protein|tara:strand:- start:126 stop:665 length:540 start_codon:yes stop_codon:yes gene_type:complete